MDPQCEKRQRGLERHWVRYGEKRAMENAEEKEQRLQMDQEWRRHRRLGE